MVFQELHSSTPVVARPILSSHAAHKAMSTKQLSSWFELASFRSSFASPYSEVRPLALYQSGGSFKQLYVSDVVRTTAYRIVAAR